jgi:hypothetical protein
MSTTEVTIYPGAALLVPRGHDGSITFAKNVLTSVTNSSYFNPKPAELATLEADTAAYDKANVEARGGGVIALAARKAARRKVITDLHHIRDRVQAVAETQTSYADAAAVIVSAGMKVRKVVKRNKPPVHASYGPTSGSVVLDALRVAPIAMYFWQFSLNQKDWSDLPRSMKAKVLVSGLTPGQTYYFRFHAEGRKGPVDFSQIVSLLVR